MFLFLSQERCRIGRDVGAETVLGRALLVQRELHLGTVLVVNVRAAGRLAAFVPHLEGYRAQGLHVALLCYEV